MRRYFILDFMGTGCGIGESQNCICLQGMRRGFAKMAWTLPELWCMEYDGRGKSS